MQEEVEAEATSGSDGMWYGFVAQDNNAYKILAFRILFRLDPSSRLKLIFKLGLLVR